MEKVAVNNVRIAYEKYGTNEKNIIFLHGNGENHNVFSKMLESFKDYTCYAVDSRGHGESSFDEPFTIRQFALDIIAFCEKLNIEKASFVGYSDGANIILQIAKIYPHLIEKMALLSGNLYAKGGDKKFNFLIKTRYILTKPFMFINKVKKKGLLLKLMLDDIGVSEKDLNGIYIPTIVVGAEMDIIKKEHTNFIAANIKNSKLAIITNTTHFDMIENSHTINTVKEFILN